MKKIGSKEYNHNFPFYNHDAAELDQCMVDTLNEKFAECFQQYFDEDKMKFEEAIFPVILKLQTFTENGIWLETGSFSYYKIPYYILLIAFRSSVDIRIRLISLDLLLFFVKRKITIVIIEIGNFLLEISEFINENGYTQDFHEIILKLLYLLGDFCSIDHNTNKMITDNFSISNLHCVFENAPIDILDAILYIIEKIVFSPKSTQFEEAVQFWKYCISTIYDQLASPKDYNNIRIHFNFSFKRIFKCASRLLINHDFAHMLAQDNTLSGLINVLLIQNNLDCISEICQLCIDISNNHPDEFVYLHIYIPLSLIRQVISDDNEKKKVTLVDYLCLSLSYSDSYYQYYYLIGLYEFFISSFIELPYSLKKATESFLFQYILHSNHEHVISMIQSNYYSFVALFQDILIIDDDGDVLNHFVRISKFIDLAITTDPDQEMVTFLEEAGFMNYFYFISQMGEPIESTWKLFLDRHSFFAALMED